MEFKQLKIDMQSSVTELGLEKYNTLSLMIVWWWVFRIREEQLQQEMSEEMSNLSADHMRDKQMMLTEFNKAQELLKDKISALQIMSVSNSFLIVRF